MTRLSYFSYRVFYDNDPPRVGHTPLTDAQVDAALHKFCEDLPGHLAGDPSVTVKTEPMLPDRNARLVVVGTTLDVVNTDAAVQTCAKSHDLNATRLPHI
jgi:hypothetical protein